MSNNLSCNFGNICHLCNLCNFCNLCKFCLRSMFVAMHHDVMFCPLLYLIVSYLIFGLVHGIAWCSVCVLCFATSCCALLGFTCVTVCIGYVHLV